jgi:hypothetical protein
MMHTPQALHQQELWPEHVTNNPETSHLQHLESPSLTQTLHGWVCKKKKKHLQQYWT